MLIIMLCSRLIDKGSLPDLLYLYGGTGWSLFRLNSLLVAFYSYC